jgi:hypothetical protein
MVGQEPTHILAISSSPVKLGGITDLTNWFGNDKFILVRNDAASLGNYLPTFQRNILPLSS